MISANGHRTMEARRRGFFSRLAGFARIIPLALVFAAWSVCAEPVVPPAFPGERVLDNPEIEVRYDRLNLDLTANLLVLTGNVTVIYKDLSIRADEVQIDLERNEAEARGGVVLWRSGEQWFGEHLRYNFDTGRAGFEDSSVDGGWVFVKAPLVELEENGERIIARDAELTTCDLPEPHYHFKVGKAVLEPSRRFWIYNSVLKAGNVPLAYLPYFSRSLSPEDPTWIFAPGYSGSKGAIAMNKIAWTFNDYLHLRLLGDYYSEIGPGLGLRNRYAAPDRDNLEGFLYGYYLFGDNDNDYVQEPPEEPFEIEDDRWKIAGEHWQQFGERTTLSARYQFLSDREFNDDFKEQELLHGFESQGRELLEYERNSFVNLAHRADPFNLRLTAKVSEQELFDNDFFWNEFPEDQRLPQLRIDGKRIALFDSPLYLKTGAEFTRFKQEQQLISGSNTWLMTQEADRGVFDTELSLPLSLPWGMRLIPSLAGQASFYSDPVREFEFNDQDEVNPDRNGTYRELFDDVNRQVGVAGVELVERVVTEWDTPESSRLESLRLVTEPRVGFFYREPSEDFEDLLPERIDDNLPIAPGNIPFAHAGFLDQPFDSLDYPFRTEEQLEFHLESKLQGKDRAGAVSNYLKHTFAAAYDFEPDEDHWTELISELWLYPHSRVQLHNFVRFDPNEGELLQSNSSIGIQWLDRLSTTVGLSTYQPAEDADDQEELYAALFYQLSEKYSIEYRHRYDLDEELGRENRLTITRDMHDLLASLILRERNYEDRDHEFEIMAVVRLKFPGSGKVYGTGRGQEP